MNETATALKLNIGGGFHEIDGWINVDRRQKMEAYPLYYADESVDEIRASHILEHFPHNKTLEVIKDWVRVLKPGGMIRIAVPDFDKAIQVYQSDAAGGNPVESWIMGDYQDENHGHGAIFTETKLKMLMRMAGLRAITHWKSDIADCASNPISLNLQGVKKRPYAVQGIAAVMSMPRLCFTDTAVCMMDVLSKFKIPVRIRQGVFWGQTMTMAMKQSIEDANIKYLLTADYDTLFTPDDVEELYRLMEQIPQADAICGMQIGRERDNLLLTIKGDDGQNIPGITRDAIRKELLRITTGHFGLTIIRADSLRKLPKPWFIHTPDESNEWGKGRTDEDIWFWKQWAKVGFNLHQANNVRLGHLQLMATWPNANLQAFHQYLSEYRKDGAPMEATQW
jgi:hypothetical protein